jgi:hypothetical protein
MKISEGCKEAMSEALPEGTVRRPLKKQML